METRQLTFRATIDEAAAELYLLGQRYPAHADVSGEATP